MAHGSLRVAGYLQLRTDRITGHVPRYLAFLVPLANKALLSGRCFLTQPWAAEVSLRLSRWAGRRRHTLEPAPYRPVHPSTYHPTDLLSLPKPIHPPQFPNHPVTSTNKCLPHQHRRHPSIHQCQRTQQILAYLRFALTDLTDLIPVWSPTTSTTSNRLRLRLLH